ncbi:HTTM domain-containing protein [Microlunatus capsulatus]|uniref:Vitamin K-dependent gamma-carboxylase n=1 Tax=Microlunatus capsulatus TaxID=99117 RepID=A0ABS4Z5C7_9ACTN|nr:HTTM domain-containing protein [Microlunatus capsulatus]MBP2415947.1 hypothetical protein [Microlunatus capsulatus]
MTGPGRVVGWFAPVLPDARVAVLRTVVYLFVLVDIHLFVADPVPLSRQPDLYAPLMVERLFLLPPPTPVITTTLYVVLVVGSLVAAANRLPRLAGVVVAAAFTWWTAIGMSYGKVDHDHLAFVVALWLLPTAGVVRDRWRCSTSSRQAGWVLKTVQVAVIATYFLSALTKIRSGDWSLTSWPNSFILTWAIVRRPHGLGQFLLPFPDLLRGMQWFAFLAELTSLVVLWLRGRALLAAAVFWMGFHVFTAAILYIHFAPTLVCWLAFAPLERLPAWWDRRRAARAARTGRVVDAADVRAS